jgi:hypothetical protein
MHLNHFHQCACVTHKHFQVKANFVAKEMSRVMQNTSSSTSTTSSLPITSDTGGVVPRPASVKHVETDTVNAGTTGNFQLLADINCSTPIDQSGEACAQRTPKCRIPEHFTSVRPGSCGGEVHYTDGEETCSDLALGPKYAEERKFTGYEGLYAINPELKDLCLVLEGDPGGRGTADSEPLPAKTPVCFQAAFTMPCVIRSF